MTDTPDRISWLPGYNLLLREAPAGSLQETLVIQDVAKQQ